MSRASGLPLAGLATALLAVPLVGAANSAEGPVPGHTGGFGEPTCTECHQGPGTREAAVELSGLPAVWATGESRRITVEVRGETLRRGGFQLAARWADGPAAGTQAGRFDAGEGLRVTESEGVSYVHHTYDSTKPTSDGHVRWTFVWHPPSEGAGSIDFHVAANAANDDNSEFGDTIVMAARVVPAAARD